MNQDSLQSGMSLPKERSVQAKISEEEFQQLEEALGYYGISRSKFTKFCIEAIIALYRQRKKLSVPIEFTPGTGLPGENGDPEKEKEHLTD